MHARAPESRPRESSLAARCFERRRRDSDRPPRARRRSARRPAQVRQIEAAVPSARRADANQRDLGCLDCSAVYRRSHGARPSARHSSEQIVETRFDNRAAAAVDGCHFLGVHVNADDLMTIGGKRRRRNTSYVSKTEDRDSHGSPFELSASGCDARGRCRQALHALFVDKRAVPELEVQQAQMHRRLGRTPCVVAEQRSTAAESMMPRSRVRRSSSTSRTTRPMRRCGQPNGRTAPGSPSSAAFRIDAGRTPFIASRRMRLVVQPRSFRRRAGARRTRPARGRETARGSRSTSPCSSGPASSAARRGRS